jgi:hypothetical protein
MAASTLRVEDHMGLLDKDLMPAAVKITLR